MNPFKHKQIEEFTIADCELYISKYPYGEHQKEVREKLRKLKQNEAKVVEKDKVRQNRQGEAQDGIKVVKKNDKEKNIKTKKDPIKIVFLWVVEILICCALVVVFMYFFVVIFEDIFGFKASSPILKPCGVFVGTSICIPLHNFFKSLREE